MTAVYKYAKTDAFGKNLTSNFWAENTHSARWYNYFGSRYYDSDLSIWLSVDPLASNTPGVTSFAYCVNNPIVLHDPNGEEVFITGEESKAFFKQVRAGAKTLGISVKMDKNGLLSGNYKGKGEISNEGKQLMDAIDSKSISVNINATNKDKVNGTIFCGGFFMGNTVSQGSDGTMSAVAYQTVNPSDLKKIDDFYQLSGRQSLHEITEGFEGAKISIAQGVSSGNSTEYGTIYQQAHNAAIPQLIPPIDTYRFDSMGYQVAPGRKPYSIGFYFGGTDKQIKEVKY